ncbi:unnamed protein product [Ixodes persulcatus]
MITENKSCFEVRFLVCRLKHFLLAAILLLTTWVLLLRMQNDSLIRFKPMTAPTNASQAMFPVNQLLVATLSGLVKGKLVTVPGDILVREFLGIPFGQTTEGRGRFRKPTSVRFWTEVYDATTKRAPCVQESYNSKAMLIDNSNTTEDCLHLNIWAPIQKHNNDYNKTVMVYFYGGSFMHGGNSYFFYDGRYVSGLGDVIVVVPNYRVGVLGFLNAGIRGASGNAGLYDQILALTWVKKNIAFFGGDPEKVVLFGQSAGAISISYLQLSPMGRHLFRRAILQSCSALVPIPENSNAAAIENFREIAKATNCSRYSPDGEFSADITVACMRNLDAKNLSSVKGVYFYPSFYDEVLPDTPLRLLKNVSNFSGHDILLGNTLREGDMMFEASFHQSLQSRSKLSIDAIMRVYNFFYKRSTFVQALLTLANLQRLYDMSSSTYEGFRDAIGDVLFNCPTKYFAEVFAKKNGRAFYYVLAHKPSFSVWNSPVATHTDDVSLLFGVPFMLPHLATDKERDLSRRLIVIWTAFAKTGMLPAIEEKPWPEYRDEERIVVLNSGNFSYMKEFRNRHCAALKSLLLQ